MRSELRTRYYELTSKGYVSIFTAAKRSGLTPKQIRHYEEKKLIFPARVMNDYRMFSRTEVRMLTAIRVLRSLDMGLDDIRRIIRKGDMTPWQNRRAAFIEAEALLTQLGVGVAQPAQGQEQEQEAESEEE